MKHKILTTAMAAIMASAVQAAQPSDLLIFINPGHGGYDTADDRNVVIAPYGPADPAGYWESKSNLIKGLWLRDMLTAKGYRVEMSRTTNTSADDLPLSTIDRMANESGADFFFSIHSNATGTASRANFPLMLFRGYTDEPSNPADKQMALILNRHLLENRATYWTSSAMNTQGDWSFYTWWPPKTGLGVLRTLTVPGMLSEGSFHDYIPETYRLMSEEFCRLEAWHFRRAIDEFFGIEGETTGQVAGRINDSMLPRPGDEIYHGEDKFATVQGALVELVDAAGNVVETYTTDQVHINGLYAFRNVKPGHYTLRVSASTHYPGECEIDVEADRITYQNFRLLKIRDTAPQVVSHSPVWADGDEPVLCTTPIVMKFNWDMETAVTEKAFTINPPVEGTFAWSDLNYTMTFTPTDAYEPNTLYTVTLGTEAMHPDKLHLEKPYTFTFRTAASNRLNLFSAWPYDGASVHFNDAMVELRFDNHPDTKDIYDQVIVTDSQGNKVAFNKRKKTTSKSTSPYGFFRLVFSKDLVPGETYTIHYDASICDRNDLHMPASIDGHFTATDFSTPKADELFDAMTDATVFTFDAAASTNVATGSVTADTGEALFDNRCVAFSYKFGTGTEGSAMWLRSPLPGDKEVARGAVLGLHIYGDQSCNDLMLHFSGTNQAVKAATLDFQGWQYVTVTIPEGVYGTLTGVSIERCGMPVSVEGTVRIDRLHIDNTNAGIGDAEADNGEVTLTVGSEFLIANAPTTILGVELYSAAGAKVAEARGNVVNIMSLAPGTYVCRVITAGGTTVKKTIIQH